MIKNLLNQLLKIYNQQIRKSTDVEQLCLSVKNKSGVEISGSEIRTLLGLESNLEILRTELLDRLCYASGYKSWRDFIFENKQCPENLFEYYDIKSRIDFYNAALINSAADDDDIDFEEEEEEEEEETKTQDFPRFFTIQPEIVLFYTGLNKACAKKLYSYIQSFKTAKQIALLINMPQISIPSSKNFSFDKWLENYMGIKQTFDSLLNTFPENTKLFLLFNCISYVSVDTSETDNFLARLIAFYNGLKNKEKCKIIIFEGSLHVLSKAIEISENSGVQSRLYHEEQSIELSRFDFNNLTLQEMQNLENFAKEFNYSLSESLFFEEKYEILSFIIDQSNDNKSEFFAPKASLNSRFLLNNPEHDFYFYAYEELLSDGILMEWNANSNSYVFFSSFHTYLVFATEYIIDTCETRRNASIEQCLNTFKKTHLFPLLWRRFSNKLHNTTQKTIINSIMNTV